MVFQIYSGCAQSIVVLWKQPIKTDILKCYVENLQEKIGEKSKISLENIERLRVTSNLKESSYEIVLSGMFYQSPVLHDEDLLAEILRILKPKGKLVLQEPVISNGNSSALRHPSNIISILKRLGFANISQEAIQVDQTRLQEISTHLNISDELQLIEFVCEKPNFEVGSACRLPAAPVLSSKDDVVKVWSLTAEDTIDDDIIDDDQLLDEEDLIKPDPSSLRVCSSTGKRKACKNCSCGLAEELASENVNNAVKSVTSSCGNCYLGDAFRCSSCPYLGLPPFKPGEKISLSEDQLKADV